MPDCKDCITRYFPSKGFFGQLPKHLRGNIDLTHLDVQLSMQMGVTDSNYVSREQHTIQRFDNCDNRNLSKFLSHSILQSKARPPKKSFQKQKRGGLLTVTNSSPKSQSVTNFVCVYDDDDAASDDELIIPPIEATCARYQLPFCIIRGKMCLI